MTVSSTQSYIEYTGDGSTQIFTVPFYFILNSDLSIIVAETDGSLSDLTYGVDYSATGAGNDDGGSVTLNTAYDAGYTILIYRNPPETQETKYYENGKFPAKSHEAALDKLTMLIQKFGWDLDALALKRPNVFSSYYDAKSDTISNLADPVLDQDAVNKRYVSGQVSDFKDYVDDEVTKEATARIAGDQALEQEISAETTARENADANIQDQLTGNVPLEASAFSEISWHGQQVKNSVTIPEDKNAWSFGPQMEIAEGQAVMVSDGSSWTIANGREVEDEDLHNLVADTIKTSDGSITVNINDIATGTDLTALTVRVSTAESEIDDKAASGDNSDITSLSGLTTPLSIAQGGTGQSGITFLSASDSTSVAIATSTFTLLSPTVVTDTKSAYSSGAYTIPSDGYYHIIAECRMASGAAATAAAGITITIDDSAPTSFVAGRSSRASLNLGADIILKDSCLVSLVSGNIVRLFMQQNSGSSVNSTSKSLQIIRVA